MKLKTIISMLSCILCFSFAGCDDKDYSDDIDALKKELEETKASIKTIQDLTNALQNQLFIDSYEKNDNGYTLKMSDGSNITVKQGVKGEDGTDAPTITDINETGDALEFIFSDGSTITLPRNEKYDVITLTIETTSTFPMRFRYEVSEFSSSFWGQQPTFPYPEYLEINWGDGRITGSSEHEYKTPGIYSVTIKAKQINALNLNDSDKVKDIDISQCHNLKSLNLDCCEGNITLSNSKDLVTIYDNGSEVPTLNLDNLPSLRCVDIRPSTLNEFNITNCPKMEILKISSTTLSSIDISDLINLYELDCHNSSISTIWVWEGFDPANYIDWSVPDGVEYKVKQ